MTENTKTENEGTGGPSALSAGLGAWISVSQQMPEIGRTVLACYTNGAGKVRRIRAAWIAAKSSEASPESEIAEYDEEADCYYDPEGWYEQIDNWDDYSAVAVYQGEITHWMPLPEAPNDQIQRAPKASAAMPGSAVHVEEKGRCDEH